ncbi:hypothetical protein N7G274_000315 [Stereocaulon virgatum]|uniref:Uncharacterized protein n=1 Tax=Stereocaulon virgatum TaxID=373712 RepID=A0ABR4ARS0_9LECA
MPSSTAVELTKFLNHGLETSGKDLLRPHEKSLITRNICILVLIWAWIGTLASLIGATLSFTIGKPSLRGNIVTRLSSNASTYIPLLFSLAFTMLYEGTGLLHTASLRWSLWHEGRLHSNTNLRLFTSSRLKGPNSWYTNLVLITSIILCYVAVGQVLFNDEGLAGRNGRDPTNGSTFLEGIAFAALAIGLFCQSAITTWALICAKGTVASWESDPLNNALACLKSPPQRPDTVGEDNFGPRTSSLISSPTNPLSSPTVPLRRQANIYETSVSATRVMYGLWLVFLTTLVWAITIYFLTRAYGVPQRIGSGFLISSGILTINMLPKDADPPQAALDIFSLLFVFAFQTYLTVGLHCAELIVNVSRDEDAWRDANKLRGKGAQLSLSAVATAFASWKTIVLFLFKASVHWVFGRCMRGGGTSRTVDFYIGPLWILTTLTFALAAFGTFLAFHRPPGPQPAAYGQLETLAALIDDWADEGENLYWGDKGPGAQPGTRLAGTSGDKTRLGPINYEYLYQFMHARGVATSKELHLSDSIATVEETQAPDTEADIGESSPLVEMRPPSPTFHAKSPVQ